MANKLLLTIFICGLIILIVKCDTNDYFTHIYRTPYSLRHTFQEKYDSVLALFGNNDFNLNVFATFILVQIVYWGFGTFYTILDLTKWPQFLYKYKIQDTNTKISFGQIVPLIKQVMINQILVGFWFVLLSHYAFIWRGGHTSPILPHFREIIIQLFWFVVIEEIGFYYTHRLLHNRHIYKYVHKTHHEWQAPIAITAMYCHPFEYFFSNLLPVLLGPVILGSHRITYWIWLSIVLIFTLNDHSGYHFPYMPSPEFHDFHHLKFTQNFGVFGIMDRIHGTDSVFRKAIQFKRHKILTNLVPLKLAIPEKL